MLEQYQIDSGQMFHELGLFFKRRMEPLQANPHQDLAAYMPLFHLFNIRLTLFPQQRWPG